MARKKSPGHRRRGSVDGFVPGAEGYKLVCLSLYNEDIIGLNEMVNHLRGLGARKVYKSEIIRFLLEQMNHDGGNLVRKYLSWKETKKECSASGSLLDNKQS